MQNPVIATILRFCDGLVPNLTSVKRIYPKGTCENNIVSTYSSIRQRDTF